MTDTIALTGIVATTPRHLVTSTGLAITSFRLACRQRRFDRVRNAWVDADTNWYTVSCFRQLAHNVQQSVHKGEPVFVAGRLRIRDWETEERAGTSVEVEADAVGHNLTWGTTALVRSAPQPVPDQTVTDQPYGEPTAGADAAPVGDGAAPHTESETQSA